MDQQIVTIVCGCVIALSLFASYLKHRMKKDDSSESRAQSVSQVFDETCAYFGIDTAEGDGVSRALDLAPLQMISTMTAPAKKRRRGSARR